MASVSRAALWVLVCALQAAAAQAPAAAPLAAVSFAGSRRFSAEQLQTASGLAPGRPVTRDDLQAAADRLAATGLFTSVRYRFATGPEGVRVEFQLEDAPTVPVVFDNFPWFTDDELRQALQQRLGLFDGTAPEAGGYVEAIGAELEKLLAERGVQARVEHRLLARPEGNGLEQLFRVIGPVSPVVRVEFSDPLAGNDPHIAERLGDLIGKPYSRYATEVFLIEQVRPVYLSHGYLRVELGTPEARLEGNPNRPQPGLVVRVPVTPGPVYHWCGASWSGNSVLRAEELDRLLGLREGQVADGVALAGGWERIRQRYGASGYLDVQLELQPAYDDAHACVRYQVTVTEGRQYRMGRLVISGLSPEAEKRVRQAWLLHPGQVFDLDYYRAFLDEIARRALADLPVHFERIGHLLDRHPAQGTVDVLLDFD
jgi:outer membrane protein assembly factor BamA